MQIRMLARTERIQPNSLLGISAVVINPSEKFMSSRKLSSQTQTAIKISLYTTHKAIKHQENPLIKTPSSQTQITSKTSYCCNQEHSFNKTKGRQETTCHAETYNIKRGKFTWSLLKVWEDDKREQRFGSSPCFKKGERESGWLVWRREQKKGKFNLEWSRSYHGRSKKKGTLYEY